MPKLPRDVSHGRLVRFLLKRGWRVAREGGRHTVLEKRDVQVAVPRHGRLKTGTVAAVCKQAGVEEWDGL